ncbi:peptidase M75 family protein [Paractinoplanes ferrugineus]|uniref:Lipoprotein n=1 Tax=Paractinoplanes ferrugineus TaxID=113564 RepID=A0A919J716_9ACTN|nr:iron uptake system protein EfeO [Actinoplanes ferrugineus]GIE15685.1 lipoprotein [Actinoplanes ferrugineus]
MRATYRVLALVAAGSLGVPLAGCGSDDSAGTTAAGETITVTATDTLCEIATSTLDAGTSIFSITNSGTKVNEFYIYGPGDRVLGEIENITPGLSRELHVELPAGSYEIACKPGMIGQGIRNPITVSGSAAPLADDAALKDATTDYTRYVKSQTAALQTKTSEFVAAVKAGDIARAKQLYPIARTYWERIEPVASVFGDLDPRIDGREDAAPDGQPFGGFHRLEKDLWAPKPDIRKDGPIADQLLTDVKEIVRKSNAEQLTALQLANGAKGLLDEVASGKITGEEDRYSHTDLWDFNANIEGCQAAIAALRPVLEKRNPTLVKTLDAEFANVDAALTKYRSGNGWKLHSELSPTDLKGLSDAVNALAEPVSKVAAALVTR